MATFYNHATLTLSGKVTSSNITEGELVSGVTLTKSAVSTNYGPGDGIVYAITLRNNLTVPKTGITLTDDLGAYTIPGTATVVVPLTYVTDSIIYYQNGVLQSPPTVAAGENLVINGIDVPANGNSIILYEVRANDFAPLAAGSTISNTVTASGVDVCEAIGDNAEIPVRNDTGLSIAKAICPPVVNCGERITYTFIIQNSGNEEVLATDNLIVADTFTPPLNNISVALNGTPLTEGTQYTYNAESGEFTTLNGAIPVPAATFYTNPETGVVTTTPGVAVITVTGTV